MRKLYLVSMIYPVMAETEAEATMTANNKATLGDDCTMIVEEGVSENIAQHCVKLIRRLTAADAKVGTAVVKEAVDTYLQSLGFNFNDDMPAVLDFLYEEAYPESETRGQVAVAGRE